MLSRRHLFSVLAGAFSCGRWQPDDSEDGYRRRAEVVHQVLGILGLRGNVGHQSAEDACRLILAVDQVACAADMAMSGFLAADTLDVGDSIIPAAELPRLIVTRADGRLSQMGWDISRIELVLQLADELLIDQFVRDEDQARAATTGQA